MLERVKKLRDRYSTATEAEKAQIDLETKALQDEDLEAWQQAMLECMKETNNRLDVLLVRERLEGVLPAISVSYIAKNYFNKSRQWFYQKMNNSEVNGKRSQFTQEELKTLDFALQDLGKKIGSVRVS
ncbi:MAG: DUF5053 domain-containing protein [Capnocytophaga sp.]|nr:DUF5053 domain-containing protein [Capnocytophaga sp.]